MARPITSLGMSRHLQIFEPTHEAALRRLSAVNPDRYALDGAVTGLSPYFTHGLLSLPDAARAIHARQPLSFEDKLVFELGWREFFHPVWQHAPDGGDGILRDMQGSLPWPGTYANVVPDNIREGRTGVPAIDSAVRTPYATGYLHNHARMWLASYVVHLRKVHWRAGADWLCGHLLDGDLSSNHLSWQWMAATFSGKPYLFNADNVLRYAPAAAKAAWASPNTIIDTSYEALEELAPRQRGTDPERVAHAGVTEPGLTGTLPGHTEATSAAPEGYLKALAQILYGPAAIKNIANTIGRPLELIHPWALSPRMAGVTGVTDAVWAGDLTTLDLSGSTQVTAQVTLFPGYRQTLAAVVKLTPAPRLLPSPAMACRSFSKFYSRVRRGDGEFADLL